VSVKNIMKRSFGGAIWGRLNRKSLTLFHFSGQ
jgi:hypothetical protein